MCILHLLVPMVQHYMTSLWTHHNVQTQNKNKGKRAFVKTSCKGFFFRAVTASLARWHSRKFLPRRFAKDDCQRKPSTPVKDRLGWAVLHHATFLPAKNQPIQRLPAKSMFPDWSESYMTCIKVRWRGSGRKESLMKTPNTCVCRGYKSYTYKLNSNTISSY